MLFCYDGIKLYTYIVLIIYRFINDLHASFLKTFKQLIKKNLTAKKICFHNIHIMIVTNYIHKKETLTN